MRTLLTLLLVITTTVAMAAPETTTRIITAADGLAIHTTSTPGPSPALVFVHGWSCDGTYWQDQLQDLAGDFQVITVDLPGHGQSATGREAYTMVAYGADVAAAIKEWDVANAIIIGHSMGGAVITEAALAAPDRVIGLIGVDNFQQLNMKLAESQIKGFVSNFESDFPNFTNQWVRSMFQAGADSALINEIATDMASAPPEVALNALTELLAWYGGFAPAELAKLKVPLMCINSDKQPTDEKAMLAVVPDYQARYMKGTGHFLFREDPVTFNKLLRETIAEIAPK